MPICGEQKPSPPGDVSELFGHMLCEMQKVVKCVDVGCDGEKSRKVIA
jgi:hypothetical protein